MARREMTHELAIDATPEQIWHALTTKEGLERWFPPHAEVREPGVGGVIWCSWGGAYEGEAKILEWEPLRRLKTTFGDPAGPLTCTYEILSERGSTVVRITTAGFGEGEEWAGSYDGINRGWKFELRGLRHALERHPGEERKVINVFRKIGDMTPEEGWARLMSADGLLAKGALGDAMKDGDPYDIETAQRDRLSGEVRVMAKPRDFAATVEGWNDAYLRVRIDDGCGWTPGNEINLWLSTYGVDDAKLEALRSRWEALADRLFAASARA